MLETRPVHATISSNGHVIVIFALSWRRGDRFMRATTAYLSTSRKTRGEGLGISGRERPASSQPIWSGIAEMPVPPAWQSTIRRSGRSSTFSMRWMRVWGEAMGSSRTEHDGARAHLAAEIQGLATTRRSEVEACIEPGASRSTK